MGNWQDFVTNDVIAYIDANYRTVSNSSERGIAGHSIGGFGVLNIALNTEGVFDYVYAMSPAVFTPEGFVTYGLQFEPVNRSIMEYQALSQQEARKQYLEKIGNSSWQPRYAFDYGSAFVPDVDANAPYMQLPERVGSCCYLRVYDGDHSSKVPTRFISHVLPYFVKNLSKK